MTVAQTPSPAFEQENEVYDLLGIGFGPANLALAISLSESSEARSKDFKFAFVERQPTFAWHPSLLLPGAQLQVSPFKDLATMRDPTSSFTFVNYLHKMGRLSASINRDATIPTRREWSAYLTWCASRMRHLVSYGEEVLSIEPITNSAATKSCVEHALSEAEAVEATGHTRLLRITSRNRATGKLVVRLARNITVGVGGTPNVPDQFRTLYPARPWEAVSRILHSGTFLPSLNAIEPELSATVERRLGRSSPASRSNWALRFAVVGGGQSAAEMALHLRRTFPAASVHMIFRASALVPSDDSSFVNSVAFDPERTDDFWASGEQEREEWRREFKRTNYSVVRYDVLNELSEQMYAQKIELPQLFPGSDGPAEGHLEIMTNTLVETAEMVSVDEGKDVTEEQVRLTLKPLKKAAEPSQVLEFDAVFLGTGFERRPASLPFMKPLQPHFPILDREHAEEKRSALGFSDDDDSRTLSGDDEVAKEMVRQRTRGITRDYRLVAWQSEPFKARPVPSPSAMSSSIASLGSSATAVSSRRNSDHSDSTLAHTEDSRNGADDVSGPTFEPNVYSFGGNEATHGLSDSLLSICAWRAGEVTESLLKRIGGRTTTTSNAKDTESMTLHETAVAGDLTSAGAAARKVGVDPKPATIDIASHKARAQAALLANAQEQVARLAI